MAAARERLVAANWLAQRGCLSERQRASHAHRPGMAVAAADEAQRRAHLRNGAGQHGALSRSSSPARRNSSSGWYPGLYARIRRAWLRDASSPQARRSSRTINVTGGESLIRQILYGRRYFQMNLASTSTMSGCPTPLAAPVRPQIMRAGIRYFSTQKFGWSLINTFRTSLSAGRHRRSAVLVHMLPEETYNGRPHALRWAMIEQNHIQGASPATRSWPTALATAAAGRARST